TFAEGDGSEIEGELGVFDPTILRNGIHRMRLYAEDLSGNSTVVENCAMVEGGLKVGQVNFPIVDMEIPQIGFTMVSGREYDSRLQEPGDFGPGWNLPSKNVTAAVTTPLGNDWGQNVGGGFITAYILVEKKQHVVVIRFSDEEIIKFKMNVGPRTSMLIPFEGGHRPMTVSFSPLEGTQGSLTALDRDRHVMLLHGSIYDVDMRLYNPSRFRYTAVDGKIFIINTEKGLESVTDTYGHTISYDDDSIKHSSGATIAIERGTGNRIETISDQLGRTYEYHYNEDGVLDRVVQKGDGPMALRFAGAYSYNMGITEKPVLKAIKAPDGTELGQFEYNSEGRLIGMIDGNGNRVMYGFDIPNHRQTVTDRLGNETLYEYDNKGNVTHKVDPQGNEFFWTYDSDSNLLSASDPQDHTKTYTYDENGNMLTETDPLGNQKEYTYNLRNQVLTKTDSMGNSTTYSYDSNGEQLTVTDAMGNTITNTYDSHGNLESVADADENTTTYEYDNSGNRTRIVDALGNEANFIFDLKGNELSKTMTRTTESGLATITTNMDYNIRGDLTCVTDSENNSTLTEYNSTGKKSATIDRNGNRTTYEYDNEGNLTKQIYPDGATRNRTYDAEGNIVRATGKQGETRQYTFNSQKLVTRTVNPDGSSRNMEYNAAGRLTAVIDERGNKTSFEYDAAGRKTKIIDPLSNEFTYTYDSNSNRLSMTDAKGNTTGYEYDALNRLTRTIFPDGTFTTMEYTSGNQKASVTNQAGNTTKFEYDAIGQLTKVIDAMEGETVYTYDEAGNLLSQTAPNNNTKNWVYDNEGRVIKLSLPMGNTRSFSYDPAGNLTGTTDFNGNSISYTYDCNNRLTGKTYPDSSEVVFTYTESGQKKTAAYLNSATTYTYDITGRITKVVNPDSTQISYTYDEKGNRISITVPSGTTHYTYDALSRLATVTDPADGVTTYTYDAVGNRSQVVYPNGAITEYTNDTLGRLVYLENKNSSGSILSSYRYTLSPTGSRLQAEENNGRVVRYTYDKLSRLMEEDITDLVHGDEAISYSYDAFGNRLSKTNLSGTTTYTYNDNDQLTAETGHDYTYNYSYDNNGNTTSKTDGSNTTVYTYGYENEMLSVETGSDKTEYAYDADSARISSTTNGTITRYLVDKNRKHAQVLEERGDNGTLTVSYIYGDDLISQHRNEAASYYHYDAQQSVRQLTNDAGIVTDAYVYDAFGVLINGEGSTENNYLYAGEQFDAAVGLYYLRARWMNQQNGRFTSMDPFVGDYMAPESLHKYSYAKNNPVDYNDPSGLFFNMQGVATAQSIYNTISKSFRIAKLFGMVKRFHAVVDILNTLRSLPAFLDPSVWAPIFNRSYGPAKSGIGFTKMSSGAFWSGAYYNLMSNIPTLTGHVLTEHKQTLVNGYAKRKRSNTSIAVFLPTPERCALPGIAVRLPKATLGGFKVSLRFGGSGQKGRLFGLGFQFTKSSFRQIFRMDHHEYHTEQKEKDSKLRWPSGDFHYHVSAGDKQPKK
ncbi:MAG: hypothetical protein GY754_46780, partial [bacterium]|nr:hypothetical protein [bacterium]